MDLYDDQQVADLLGITAKEVRYNCRPSGRAWPCSKPKRNIWRFTEAQVEQIVAMTSSRPGRKVAAGGQTSRSRGRS